MREIKFRAWDKINRKMYYGNFEIESNGAISKTYGIYTSSIHLILMQYTGLKDEKNKEIYEGDIIIVPCIGGKTHKTVEYFDACFWLVNSGGKAPLHFYTYHPRRDYKRVGNIYENPELLRGWPCRKKK